jgi:hypothetical protein
MDAADFIRAQAQALLENAARIEFDAKKKAIDYIGEQDSRDGPLMSLRHRLMMKELDEEFSPSGPIPMSVFESK